MRDMIAKIPDHRCLFITAASQHGCFTTRQADECGFGRYMLTHFVHTGRFTRLYRGVYLLRDYPNSPFEYIAAAWLAAGRDRAVVSHESALVIHDLSDVIPHAIHLTVSRSVRDLPKFLGVRIHTTTRSLAPSDVVIREGMRVTSVARTIVDCAEAGTGPEQIEMAVFEATQRAMTTPDRFRSAMVGRSQRVQSLIERSISMAPAA